MSIDPKIVGQILQPVEYQFEPKDVILYALGIGAGEDLTEQKFVYENDLQMFPTFGVIPPFPALFSFMDLPGVEINLAMLLHGEQYLEVKRKHLPVSGKFLSRPRILSLYDKGKGALLTLEAETENEKGEAVFYNSFGIFVRGEGGFGGVKGPDPDSNPPDRVADRVLALKTIPQQALLYRLSGDYNPIHVNHDFAAMGGFDRPIMHGLCTMGFAARAILREFADNDPARFKAIKVRFVGHVYPGETIVSKIWRESECKVIFQTETAERGKLCLSNAAIWLHAKDV
ncbi:MAG: MaoC family dehydratase N-terminal domain-containing protein [Dethiobacter sp.]|jgi:acyl dehydratase|nr:MaoC family dehydratase N-terminal domain-containing protein [Dethiobacter sp.]